MEDAAGVTRLRTGRRGAVVAGLVAALSLLLVAGAGLADDPAAEVAEALRSLGPPGLVWGRVAVEEESPDGAWTPLPGIEVQAYPAVPGLLAELERIRQSARGSGAQYDTAVARVRTALGAHQARVEAAGRAAASPEDSAVGKAPRSVTDPAGVFVFESLPSGEWLLVAIRVTPYPRTTAGPESRRRNPSQERRFLPKSAEPAREAEVWLTRVRVTAGERVPVLLTDRARWLVGPLR